MTRFTFLFIAHLILFLSSLLSFSYFKLALSFSTQSLLIATCCLFLVGSIYLVGDLFGQKTTIFLFKWIGGVGMGAISIGVPISIMGYLSLYLPIPQKLVGASLLTIWVVCTFVSVILVFQTPKVKKISLALNLNTPLHIVHLTDIHLNGLASIKKIQNWISKVNALEPDLIVFTGDLTDIPPHLIQKELDLLKSLKAKIGKYAISGNHDFYTKTLIYPQIAKEIGFEYLDNKTVQVAGIQLMGLPDKAGLRYNLQREKINILNTDSTKPIILLDHRPDEFESSADQGIKLQLSGHTHWGQIPPWGLLVKLRYKYGMGLSRYKDSHIYTSKGTSVWGPPMRLFGRSEIVSIRLS